MFRSMKASSGSTTEAVWRERVQQWRASGETAAVFAQGRGFAASTLRFWSSRLGAMEAPSFVQVVPRAVRGTVPASLVVEVGEARVPVAPGFDPVLLADIVRALGGATR